MKTTRKLGIALAGCGTVGAGVIEIIENRGEKLAERTGVSFEVRRILVADPTKKRPINVDQSVYTTDPQDLCRDDVDLVVEVIGGTDTAKRVVLDALKAGKPVVTANKALLAYHGAEVYRTARENNTCISFEASCAGGLPIVGALLRGLQANENCRIMGIFNSTCNFIITEMLEKGKSYEEALSDAQAAGYAEADPALDVSGGDTAHKLTVLSSLAFGLNLDFKHVNMEGIETLDLLDLQIAKKLGYACKLLGIAERKANTVNLRVHPTFVPVQNMMASMYGTCSGVSVDGDVVGNTFYAGAGAGSLPTASAVVADMIDVATGSAKCTFEQLRIYNDLADEATYGAPGEVVSSYYLRCETTDEKKIAGEFQNASLPIQLAKSLQDPTATVIITKPVTEKEFRSRLAEVSASIAGFAPTIIRVLPEGE